MTTRWRAILLLTFFSTSCQALTVFDDLGRKVELKAPAQRILTLSPHATEMILVLDGADRLVAIAPFFDYPESLSHIPRINSLGGLDREYLLSLRPDLVIAWASGNRASDLAWLDSENIPVFTSEPSSLSVIGKTLEKLGVLLGMPDKGLLASHRFANKLQHACPSPHSPPVRVYYNIWPKPPMTIGGQHWLNEVLERAGMKNVFDDIPRSIITVSPESLLSRPIEQVVSPPGSVPAWLQQLPLIESSPQLSRPGPRIVEGLSKLCEQLSSQCHQGTAD